EEGRILDTYDFVDKDSKVFDACFAAGFCRHGLNCFSIIGGKIDSLNYSGSAPDAQFMLFRTENDASETSQEEDNWVAAAERADSLGAQVFSTSLGYSVYDDTATSYKTWQLDGNTTIITRAADIAASKGIIVVNSAGNEGGKPWRIVLAPADGDSVLAIGAVNRNKIRAAFSSQGYTADGRVKPDVMALGEQTYLVDVAGRLVKGNGTSFSGPVIAGMMACLRQAYPKTPAFELQEWLKQSADRYNSPDSLYGYGIPDALKLLNAHTSPINGFQLAPNPNEGTCMAIWEEEEAFEGTIRIFDLTGRAIYAENYSFTKGWNRVPLCLEHLTNGLYPVVIQEKDKGKVKYQSKLLIRK
ncbi:MAG: S8 family serine peptidase, partial [Bacteroidia bacterium]